MSLTVIPQLQLPSDSLDSNFDLFTGRPNRLSVKVTPRLTLPVTKRTQDILFRRFEKVYHDDLAAHCHEQYDIKPSDLNFYPINIGEFFIKGVGYYSFPRNHLQPLITPIRQNFSADIMTTRPGIPGLLTNNLPALSEEAASATASPARGSAMKIDILSKIRRLDLVHVWDFWHSRPNLTGDRSNQSTSMTMTKLSNEGGIRDIKSFWELFNNFPLGNLQEKDWIHLFLQGIKPEWEDQRNIKGGSMVMNVSRQNVEAFWKEIALLAMGEKLQEAVATNRQAFNDHICGISLSPRGLHSKVTIWNRDANNADGIAKLRATILENITPALLPRESQIYYKKHSDNKEFAAAMEGKGV